MPEIIANNTEYLLAKIELIKVINERVIKFDPNELYDGEAKKQKLLTKKITAHTITLKSFEE